MFFYCPLNFVLVCTMYIGCKRLCDVNNLVDACVFCGISDSFLGL